MTDNFIDAPAEPASDRLQIVAAVLLGLAAVLGAVSSYYSAIKGGDSADTRADSGRTLADANFFFAEDAQTRAQDSAIFVPYAEAVFRDEEATADYLITLMRPPMADAVEWWSSTDEAVTPFDEIDGNPYYAEGAQDSLSEAAELQDLAEEQVAHAERLDAQGDRFDLAVTLLALTLFFGGIATLFRSSRVTIALLTLAAVGLVTGATTAVTAF